MKQNQLTRNSNSVRKKSILDLIPGCSISSILSICSPISQFSKNSPKMQENNYNKYYLSPNIQLDSHKPNTMIYHNFQKYDTFEYNFNNIFLPSAKNIQISNSINLYQLLVKQRRDTCLLIMGHQKGGIKQLCEGKNASQNQGLLFTLIAQLWHSLQAQRDNEKINQFQIKLKMIVNCQDRRYDLFFPKNQAQIKDSSNKKPLISNCSVYQVINLYELYQKLSDAYTQKDLLFSEGILIVEIQTIISRQSHLIADQNIEINSFMLIQWPRVASKKSNNNQALLTFNLCLYELYKISCHNPSNLQDIELKKLWSNFRSSFVTMVLKHYFMHNNKIIFMACISIKEAQQQQNFQILTICKNICKIDFKDFINYIPSQSKNYFKIQQKDGFSNKKMKTEPIETYSPDKNQLLQIKQNLKKIIKQKEQTQQNAKKQGQLINLMRQQKNKKRQLESIRYKKQQIRILNDYSKLSKLGSRNNSRTVFQAKTEGKINLPIVHSRHMSQISQNQINNLNKSQQQKINEIDSIHQRIISSLEAQPNQKLKKNVLEMQIKLQEKQIVDYINNKNKIMNLLRKQVQEIKNIEKIEKSSSKKITQKYKKKPNYSPNLPRQKQKWNRQSQNQTLQLNTIDSYENPEKVRQQKNYNTQKNEKEIFSYQNIKKLNKNNYLFQKRRLMLKAKISKGRQQVNQFYERAACKFQQYHRK